MDRKRASMKLRDGVAILNRKKYQFLETLAFFSGELCTELCSMINIIFFSNRLFESYPL